MVEVGKSDEGRLYWRSRRGMLELELVLVPFLRERYPHLPPNLQCMYAELLECEDWQIFDWLQGRSRPERSLMKQLIERINAIDDGG